VSEILLGLKKDTQKKHDSLESVSYAKEIMSGQLTLDHYKELIQKNFLIFSNIEPFINAQVIIYSALDSFKSLRLADLTADMTLLSILSPNQESPSLNFEKDLASTLGVLYVLEGSRLGNKIILNALSSNKALSSVSDFHFYKQKGISVGGRWGLFRSKVAKHITTEEDVKRMTIAAKDTFAYFHHIFEK